MNEPRRKMNSRDQTGANITVGPRRAEPGLIVSRYSHYRRCVHPRLPRVFPTVIIIDRRVDGTNRREATDGRASSPLISRILTTRLKVFNISRN